MRSAVVAAFFAGVAMAHWGAEQSTVYETEVETITSCGPTVSNCPARTHTVAPVESETHLPWTSTEAVAPVETTLASMPHFNGSHPWPSSGASHHPWSSEPACGGVSVKTISTSITTVIPTVIYETVSVPCETHTAPGTAVIPTGGYASPSTGPSTTSPVFTAGASSMGVSMVAAAAGLIALLA